jgi:hypothetical protein
LYTLLDNVRMQYAYNGAGPLIPVSNPLRKKARSVWLNL